MNAKARALGMKSTTYVDPTGLSTANRSTAADLAALLMVATKNPVLAEYSTTREFLLPMARGRQLLYRNSNRLVKSPKWEIELQKTGYLVKAEFVDSGGIFKGAEVTQRGTPVGKVEDLKWSSLDDIMDRAEAKGEQLLIVLLDAGSSGNRARDAERLRQLAAAQPASTRAASLNRR